MEERYVIAAVGICVGLFSLICGYNDYEWFMAHRKAKFMTKILGRKGARIFYMLLGFVILIVGLLALAIGLPARL